MNACVYGRTRRWVFTERPVAAEDPARQARDWRLGSSRIAWEAGRLVVELDERTAPWGQRLRGRVVLEPELGARAPLALDSRGQHQWWPLAARSRARVELEVPALRFEGAGYHDRNWGNEPLERAFQRWTWCRAWLPGGGVAMLYDTVPRQGAAVQRGLLLRPSGEEGLDPAHAVALPGTLFGVARATRAEEAGGARLLRSLEDAPFYNRNLLSMRLGGAEVQAVHESLDLDRFQAGWVQWMLPWKARREEG